MKKIELAAIRFSISFCAGNLAIDHLWRSVLLEIDSEQGPPLPSNISEPFAYDLATLGAGSQTSHFHSKFGVFHTEVN